MPGVPASRRRAFNTRGRGGFSARQHDPDEFGTMSEPPRKRRKYIPGGPGGGGRFSERGGMETPGSVTGAEMGSLTSRREGRGLRNITSTGNITPYGRPDRPRRERRAPQQESITRPRYSSAAAAAAAVVQGDGFKPREERGWEEFHEHLEIDAELPVFPSALVDGIVKEAATDENEDLTEEVPDQIQDTVEPASPKKRIGRPPKNQNAMLKGIGALQTPRAVPIPGPNPREKLTLPRPSFKAVDPFISYEKANGSIDYVDKAMANVGYQESDHFDRPDRGLIRLREESIDEELEPLAVGEAELSSAEATLSRVEYDMDKQDQKWLEGYNAWRKTEQVEGIKPALFEITMTKIEKEWHALEKRIPKPNPKPPQTHRPRSSSAAAVNGEPAPDGEEQDTKCAICDDGDCENTNAIVFCDGCDLAVHQECYGVPFIPEGQWLCRKCHLIGSGTPTCVFCPNTDGAFKQTNSARWAHLLCAIWIPEVSLGNTTFMEPVMDVEKVPKSRWRLNCDICKQKMGACIQCGHKACYTAFHVTCARRARWFVSMKSNHGGSANLDASMLRAYCGNHVSEEWAQTYNTDRATKMARKYYRKAMRGKIWADSHQAANNLPVFQMPSIPAAPIVHNEDVLPKITLTLGANKRKKLQATGKPVWKLPSGAPVVPASLFNALDNSLIKFGVRKRREFAADMCRYWTLKREAKRGAALIKRLQLQMETFSSMEITRRNFAGMGAIGGARLQRRIDFAAERIREIDLLIEMSALLKEREATKLRDAEILREVVDTTYFPVAPLLWSVLEKAEHHDGKEIFKMGLANIRNKLERRGYASVAPIYADLGLAFAQALNSHAHENVQDSVQNEDDQASKKQSDSDDKAKKSIAKRILRAVQPIIESALYKESQLNQLPLETTLLDFDQLLVKSQIVRRLSDSSLAVVNLSNNKASEDADQSSAQLQVDIDQANTVDESTQAEVVDAGIQPNGDAAEIVKQASPQNYMTPSSIEAAHLEELGGQTQVESTAEEGNAVANETNLQPQQAPTPPMSTNSSHQPAQQVLPINTPEQITPLTLGGVPWYMQSFEPAGLTLYEEVWTGRELAREGSEELSELDELEMEGVEEEGNLQDNTEIPVSNSPRGSTTGRGRGRGGWRGRGKSRGRGRGRGRGLSRGL